MLQRRLFSICAGVFALSSIGFGIHDAEAQIPNIPKSISNTAKKAAQEVKSSKAAQAPAPAKAAAQAPAAAPANVKADSSMPSSAAQAVDPYAKDNTVMPGYTKSQAQIRAAYENDSQRFSVFPKPYYDPLNRIYYNYDENIGEQHDRTFNLIAKDVGNGRQNDDMKTYVTFMLRPDNKIVPYGEFVISAYVAEFLADPQGLVPYEHLVKAYALHRMASANYKAIDTHSGSDLKVDVEVKGGRQAITLFNAETNKYERITKDSPIVKDGTVSLAESERDRQRKWNDIFRKLTNDLSIKPVPLDNILTYGNQTAEELNNRRTADSWDPYIYTIAYQLDLICEHAKEYVNKTSDPSYAKNKDQLTEFLAFCKANSDVQIAYDSQIHMKNFKKAHTITMDQLPKAAKSDSALEKDFKRIGSGVFKDETVEKVIIIYPNWGYHKNVFGAIVDRYITAGLLLKAKDNTRRLVHFSIKQNKTGSGYGPSQQYGVGAIYTVEDGAAPAKASGNTKKSKKK